MRLLKHHPDETETETDETEVDAAASDQSARAPERATGHRWVRRTVTVPVTVPQQSVRRTAVVPSRSVGRSSAWARVTLGPIMAIAAGAALTVVGCVVLIRTGVDGTWFRPRVEVLDADHTALLGVLEIGVGLVILLGGLTGSRVLVAMLGLAMALGATAIAIEPEELQRELAIERWWAWTLAAVGVVLALSAVQAPLERRQTVVDVS